MTQDKTNTDSIERRGLKYTPHALKILVVYILSYPIAGVVFTAIVVMTPQEILNYFKGSAEWILIGIPWIFIGYYLNKRVTGLKGILSLVGAAFLSFLITEPAIHIINKKLHSATESQEIRK